MLTRICVLIVAGFLIALNGAAQQAGAPEPVEESQPPVAEADAGAEDQGETADEDEDYDDYEFLEEIPAEEQLVFPVDI